MVFRLSLLWLNMLRLGISVWYWSCLSPSLPTARTDFFHDTHKMLQGFFIGSISRFGDQWDLGFWEWLIGSPGTLLYPVGCWWHYYLGNIFCGFVPLSVHLSLEKGNWRPGCFTGQRCKLKCLPRQSGKCNIAIRDPQNWVAQRNALREVRWAPVGMTVTQGLTAQ